MRFCHFNGFQIKSYRYFCEKSVSRETKNFDKLAGSWWNLNGPFYALHSMNEVRIPWIVDAVRHKTPKRSELPLEGLKILDIGCGGGILSIPLAKLGANVTGIDLSEESIAVCKHVVSSREKTLTLEKNINFRCCSIEELAFSSDEKFDAVIASEVVEHVDELNFFTEGCSNHNGHIFITTINRNILSLIFAKYVAEYILRIVPQGIHSYSKFVTPNEMKLQLLKNGFSNCKVRGLMYNFLTNNWSWAHYDFLNYAIHAKKTAKEF